MLLSNSPPMLPEYGLSGDPFGITDVLGIVSNFMAQKSQEKIAKKQIEVQQAQLKQVKVENAQSFAQQQASALVADSEKQRQDQVMALFAVGGAAVVVAGLFIYGAVKK